MKRTNINKPKSSPTWVSAGAWCSKTHFQRGELNQRFHETIGRHTSAVLNHSKACGKRMQESFAYMYIYTKAMDVCTNKHQTAHECLGLVSKTFENQCFSSRVRLIVIPSRAINKGTGRWLGFAAAKLACAWENLLSELAEFEPWDMFKICGPSRSTSS